MPSIHLDSALELAHNILDNTLLTRVFGVGAALSLVLAAKTFQDGRSRGRERKSVTSNDLKYLTPAGRGQSFLQTDKSQLPSVAFIMPVKLVSIKSANPIDNWRSQVLTAYQGKHESIFVVESDDDGAVPILKQLQQELKGQAKIRIVVAGLTGTCTQKIHNMVAGVKAASADMQYVFFLDANGHMHAGTVGNMVSEIEKSDNIFVVSGFPLDIPPAGASLWSWVMCQFRYNVLIGLKEGGTPWGGALLMRREDILKDACGIKTRWLEGGYSDDLLVGACARDFDRDVVIPYRAIFPNNVKKDVTFAQAWDFIRRQIFTLVTYGSPLNHVVHSVGMMGFSMVSFCLCPALCLSYVTAASAGLVAYHKGLESGIYRANFYAAIGYHLSLLGVVYNQRRYLRTCASLASSLSPGDKPREVNVNLPTQLASLLGLWFLAPWITLSVVLKRSSEWGGITYSVSHGKVVLIERPGHSPIQVEKHPDVTPKGYVLSSNF